MVNPTILESPTVVTDPSGRLPWSLPPLRGWPTYWSGPTHGSRRGLHSRAASRLGAALRPGRCCDGGGAGPISLNRLEQRPCLSFYVEIIFGQDGGQAAERFRNFTVALLHQRNP